MSKNGDKSRKVRRIWTDVSEMVQITSVMDYNFREMNFLLDQNSWTEQIIFVSFRKEISKQLIRKKDIFKFKLGSLLRLRKLMHLKNSVASFSRINEIIQPSSKDPVRGHNVQAWSLIYSVRSHLFQPFT